MGCNNSKQVEISGKSTQPAASKKPSQTVPSETPSKAVSQEKSSQPSQEALVGKSSSPDAHGKPVPGDLYVAWASAPCRATFMTCAALGIKPNLKVLDLFKGETRTPEFIAINPTHTVPTFVDGDFTLWESRAIMPYFVTMYGKPDDPLYPKDPQKRAMVDNVLNADQSTIYKAILEWAMPQFSGKTEGVDMNEKLEAVKKGLKTLDEFYLAKHSYLAGPQLTICDFSVVAGVLFTEFFAMDLSEYPNVVEWLKRMKKLPYFDMCNQALYEMKKAREKQQQN